jgi:hypothetical protein
VADRAGADLVKALARAERLAQLAVEDERIAASVPRAWTSTSRSRCCAPAIAAIRLTIAM